MKGGPRSTPRNNHDKNCGKASANSHGAYKRCAAVPASAETDLDSNKASVFIVGIRLETNRISRVRPGASAGLSFTRRARRVYR
jgi:hypothetical protein